MTTRSSAPLLPRYPVYVPSKSRYDTCYTAAFLLRDGVPFRLVVEPSEAEHYARAFPDAELLVTPHDGMRLLGARNFIREHALAAGHDRHWQIDDNIKGTRRLYRGKRIPCHSGVALRAVEDFTDRYTNIGVSGLNYSMFTGPTMDGNRKLPPFHLNCHVYSCSLVNNRMPYHWRLLYNDDVDLCLQVLAGGLCTVNVNAFSIDKLQTMVVKGGNTDDLYRGDGRLLMARSLERMWPGVVTTTRRFGRPQHWVDWKRFDTPLQLRDDVALDALPRVDEYGLTLRAVAEVRSDALRALLDERGSST